MSKRDAALRKLNKEVDFCMTERCRLRGQLESREITSQEHESGSESNGKRFDLAVARRNTRMAELGMSHVQSVDSLIL